MKSGKSIVELAKQLEDIRNNSKDFIVPTAKLSMKVVGMERGLTQPQPLLTFTNCGSLEPFRIEVSTVLRFTDEGEDFLNDKGADQEWQDDSYCECVECDFAGKVADFKTE